MVGSWFSKSVVCASALAGLILVASCGKAPQPIPQVAPPPSTNNPYGGGFSGGGSCGATGIPVAQISSSGFMFTSQLSSQQGNGTIAMNVYMADQYYSTNVNVSANISIQSAQGNFQFCANTAGMYGNQPGTAMPGGQYGPTGLRATLTGPVNMPVYSPWNGQVTHTQGFATVKIGIACPASYGQGRVNGCVEITIQGSPSQYFPMTAGY